MSDVSPLEITSRATRAAHLLVAAERVRQDAKWGEQNHPSFSFGITSGEHNCGYYNIPTAEDAKASCDQAFKAGHGTFGDILLEEVCEAFEEVEDDEKLEIELVQVAAVAISWIEAIHRRRIAASARPEA